MEAHTAHNPERHRGTEHNINSFSVSLCLSVSVWVCVVAIIWATTTPLSAQLSPRPTRPQVVPPQGPVRQVIFKSCTSCHGIDDYAYNALDRAGWDAHIPAKHKDLNVPL